MENPDDFFFNQKNYSVCLKVMRDGRGRFFRQFFFSVYSIPA